MGNFYDNICCISNEEILEIEISRNSYFCESTFSSKGQVTSTSRLIPFSIIDFHQNDQSQDRIFSLSKLPISTLNVIREQEGNPLTNYHPIKLLGRGTFGNVYKIRHKVTGNIRAMKIIPKNNLRPGFTDDEIRHEIDILKNLDHPKIIKLYEFYSDKDNYYLINEYCSEGGLDEKLHKIKHFPECIVKVLMFQIFSAVFYLHSRGVIHGDLKMENILIDSVSSKSNHEFLTSIKEDADSIQKFILRKSHIPKKDSKENKELFALNKAPLVERSYTNTNSSPKFKFSKLRNYDLKLIDFGSSKIFAKYKKTFEDTIGTLAYCSPEVLRNNYNEKCDIWACGVTMYILLSGQYPFYGKTEGEITTKILAGKFSFDTSPEFDKVSTKAKSLISRCLTYDKSKRISAKDALQHPFFTEDIDPFNVFQENIESKEVLISLKNFSKYSKFYQAVLTFISHNYASKAELDKLKKIFISLDLNFDGKISKEELKHAYEKVGVEIEDEQLEKIFQSMDFDNNGFIEYEEFIRASIPKEHLFTEVNLKSAFDLFDLNKKGSISLRDIEEVLGMGENVDKSVIKEFQNEVNKKENEEMNFEQFKSLILSFGTETKNN